MRRQTRAGEAMLAGSSRVMRLDPLSLPIAFDAGDRRADGHVRRVELTRDRVVVRRVVRGIRMTINLHVSEFLGVALGTSPAEVSGGDGAADLAMLTLAHRDPSLSVPLLIVADETEAALAWRNWSHLFGLPRLVATPEGALHDPFGALDVAPRRRRRNAIRKRRPSILMRRRGHSPLVPLTFYDKSREIIARD